MHEQEAGQILAHLLTEKGWSKADLARRLDVNWRTVFRWENGQTTPRGKIAERLRALAADTVKPAAGGGHPALMDLGAELRKQASEIVELRKMVGEFTKRLERLEGEQ